MYYLLTVNVFPQPKTFRKVVLFPRSFFSLPFAHTFSQPCKTTPRTASVRENVYTMLTEVCTDALPHKPMLHICEYLDFRTLCSLSMVICSTYSYFIFEFVGSRTRARAHRTITHFFHTYTRSCTSCKSRTNLMSLSHGRCAALSVNSVSRAYLFWTKQSGRGVTNNVGAKGSLLTHKG